MPGEDKTLNGNCHITIEGLGSGLQLFSGFTPPSETLNIPAKKTWAQQGGAPVNSLAAGRQVDYGTATFARGIDTERAFNDWMKEVKEKGIKGAKKNLTVKVFDAEGQPLVTYNITGAVPQSLQHPSYDANGTEVLIETLTVQVTESEIV